MDSQELFSSDLSQAKAGDLKNIVLQYTRYWYLFLLGAVLSISVAFFYLRYYAVPQYIVSGTMLIKDDKSGQSLSNADALSDLNTFKATRNVDNEIEVLKSKGLMERVIRELDLVTRYYVEERITDREIYGEALPFRIVRNGLDSTMTGKSIIIHLKKNNFFDLEDYKGITTSHRFGQKIHKAFGSFTVITAGGQYNVGTKIIVYFQDIYQVANHYSQAINIKPVGKTTNVLNISLIDPMPERAKNIVDKLMQVYNDEAIDDKKQLGTSALKFLDERLKFVTTELSTVEKGVASYKSTNSLTDIAAQATSYAEQATNYDSQIAEWATQSEVLESLENYLKNNNNSIVPNSLGIKDETLAKLIGRFNEVELERQRMLRTMQPTSVLIQNTNEQLADLRVNILETLRNIKNGLRISVNNLKASSRQFQSKVQRAPALERELQEINRSQAIKQNIYMYLLQKREETALSLAATASAARVLDFAKGGDYPISPNKQTIYLMAVLLGLGLPMGGIYLSGLLNNKVRTQQDITSTVSVPILGEIAHNDENETLVVTTQSRSPIAEMFRLVRTNLHFAVAGKENIVLLVTSSMSGEGKTFFSINIGSSYAATGKRVLLLDLDMRMPKVAEQLELAEKPGIADYLTSNKILVSDIITSSDKVPGLFIAGAGSVPPNPAELMLSPKFAHFIEELKVNFDCIIMDSPPVGLVADALTLAHYVDLTVYIVRYDYTKKEQLSIVNNCYKNKTLTRPMIVLNDAKAKNGSNYGYGYGYGYQIDSKSKKRKKPTNYST
ncbi:GumC family protein [Hymenobacter arizonensis]|uniref:non-specific protein-tyrosine kinase n=1 Tax=Hymenobacter arizonensis TaxID=1227077 RepID=A0A1I6BRK6_HYMAR|nr:tyrosine-protein kinase [Hymenobacter arizonensis]SFQ83576.1 capsular exopolysaccharide family [Hymenobacter arizonensis]